jgi:hypothetical protein
MVTVGIVAEIVMDGRIVLVGRNLSESVGVRDGLANSQPDIKANSSIVHRNSIAGASRFITFFPFPL